MLSYADSAKTKVCANSSAGRGNYYCTYTGVKFYDVTSYVYTQIYTVYMVKILSVSSAIQSGAIA